MAMANLPPRMDAHKSKYKKCIEETLPQKARDA